MKMPVSMAPINSTRVYLIVMRAIIIAAMAALSTATTALADPSPNSRHARPSPKLDLDALRQKQQEAMDALGFTPEKIEILSDTFQSLFPEWQEHLKRGLEGDEESMEDLLGNLLKLRAEH